MFTLQPHLLEAQGFYVRAGGGYAWEAMTNQFNNADPNELTMITPSTETRVSSDGSTLTIEKIHGTLGEGYRYSGTVGYMVHSFIGLELEVTYFKGTETLIGSFDGPGFQSESTSSIEGFDAMPAVILTPGLEKLNPYARIGLLLTVAGDQEINTTVFEANGAGPGTDLRIGAEAEVESEFSVGYAAALGATYPLSDRLSLFGEAKFIAFTIESESASLEEFTTLAEMGGQAQPVPGQQLEDLPVSRKEFVFDDIIRQPAQGSPPPNEPRVLPSQRVNASSIGFNLGIR
ncbi:MAG: outer membrane beta-barrel protein, partial [Saprospiraceae bacterium]|nr:outer membrane beta-barrel protein [Saprospiraceae bacterium]